MRRSGYNSLGNSEENTAVDEVDSPSEDIEEATPFTEIRFSDGRTYKRTLCLVFTLFFGGFVSIAFNPL